MPDPIMLPTTSASVIQNPNPRAGLPIRDSLKIVSMQTIA
jgi:hypothetical protein